MKRSPSSARVAKMTCVVPGLGGVAAALDGEATPRSGVAVLLELGRGSGKEDPDAERARGDERRKIVEGHELSKREEVLVTMLASMAIAF